jgi:hypothetical protein
VKVDFMNIVLCPTCGQSRTVKAKKPWMVGEQPYKKICKSCCQVGKQKTDEHRAKLSQSVKNTQNKEVIERKREFMLQNPDLWVKPEPELGQDAWRGKHHSDESKKKISEGVKSAKNKGEK